MTTSAHHTFRPWRARNNTRIVAAESAWRAVLRWEQKAKADRTLYGSSRNLANPWQSPRVLIDVDVCEEHRWPLVDASGKMLSQCCQCQHRWAVPDAELSPVAPTPLGHGCCPKCKSVGPNRMSLADARARLFDLITRCPHLTFLLRTEHPERLAEMMPERPLPKWAEGLEPFDRDIHLVKKPWPNVWLGVTVHNQQEADECIPHLLRMPAAVRWVDYVAAGAVDFNGAPDDGEWGSWWITVAEKFWTDYGYEHDISAECGIDWLVCRGETGPNARPAHPDWVRAARDQCLGAGVPYFFESWGEFLPVPVFDCPKFSGGRAFDVPDRPRVSATFRERSKKAFHSGVVRQMKAGDRNGYGVMLADDLIALEVGSKRSGRTLDGREWGEVPVVEVVK